VGRLAAAPRSSQAIRQICLRGPFRQLEKKLQGSQPAELRSLGQRDAAGAAGGGRPGFRSLLWLQLRLGVLDGVKMQKETDERME
jgi:hypothetical protein